jgi:hypothetical protein
MKPSPQSRSSFPDNRITHAHLHAGRLSIGAVSKSVQATELQAALGQGWQNIAYASPATAFEDSRGERQRISLAGLSLRTPRFSSSMSSRAPWT